MLLLSNASESIITPALPSIAHNLAISNHIVQYSITLFMLAFALSQFAYGYLSDRIGRKRLFVLGAIIFAIGNLICSLSQNMTVLLVGRIIQGCGASAGSVLVRAIVRDSLPPIEQRIVFSKIMSIISFTPVLAPVLGGFILYIGGWRLNFIALGSLSLVVIFLAIKNLSETHHCTHNKTHFFKSFFSVLQQRQFVVYAIMGGCLLSLPFIYLIQAPFILIKDFNISPILYGASFLLSAGFGSLGARTSAKLARHFQAENLIRLGILAALGIAVFQIIFYLLNSEFQFNRLIIITMIVLSTGLLLFFAFLAKTNVSPKALQSVKMNFGMSSAFLGATQMGIATLITSVMQYFNVLLDNPWEVLIISYLLATALGMVCVFLQVRGQIKSAGVISNNS